MGRAWGGDGERMEGEERERRAKEMRENLLLLKLPGSGVAYFALGSISNMFPSTAPSLLLLSLSLSPWLVAKFLCGLLTLRRESVD